MHHNQEGEQGWFDLGKCTKSHINKTQEIN